MFLNLLWSSLVWFGLVLTHEASVSPQHRMNHKKKKSLGKAPIKKVQLGLKEVLDTTRRRMGTFTTGHC